MMKRLLLALGVLAITSAVYAAGSTTFNFKFPKFAAVFVNVENVYFFNEGASGSNSALAPSSGSKTIIGSDVYYASTEAGVVSCIDDRFTTSALSVTIQSSSGSDSLTSISCLFAPTKVAKYSSTFSVSGYDNVSDSGYNAASPPTDGELLIVTNTTNFNIGTTVDTGGGGVPSGMTLKVYPGFVEKDSNENKKLKASSSGASWKSLNSAYDSTALFTQADAFNTNYKFAKVIPLLFRVDMSDVLTEAITTNQKLVVTWNAAAQ